jgi:hypothetical protein
MFEFLRQRHVSEAKKAEDLKKTYSKFLTKAAEEGDLRGRDADALWAAADGLGYPKDKVLKDQTLMAEYLPLKQIASEVDARRAAHNRIRLPPSLVSTPEQRTTQSIPTAIGCTLITKLAMWLALGCGRSQSGMRAVRRGGTSIPVIR